MGREMLLIVLTLGFDYKVKVIERSNALQRELFIYPQHAQAADKISIGLI
jgi:hypothetical protein